MSETGALIRLGGAMPKPYSQDLRVRVVEAVVGGASRREVAELYGISPSVVVIWIRRWNETGRIAAKSSGGSVSPLDEHAEFLLGLIVEQPDMTLDEIVAAMSRAGIEGSRTALWRFYERHDISFKKNFVCRRAEARRCDPRAPTLDARARHV
jgi:transposase